MKKLFEAELKNNTGIPDKYFEKLVQRGRALYGHGPTGRDLSEFAQMMFAMFGAINGHEEELTDIGIKIIMDNYGEILEGVKLDIKIIKPGDEEQMEMAQETTAPPEVETEDEDISHLAPDIDKRKLLNTVMQGESQNIHDLLYYAKDEIEAIDPNILRLDLGVIKKDILLHWNDNLDLQAAMEQSYQYANIVKVIWPEEDLTKKEIEKPKDWKPGQDDDDEEEKEEGPTIKVRALMLSGLIHETVKGIYELIAARGIEDDPEKMKRVLSQTDDLDNEKEDIQFGSFVAGDLRDFINKAMEGTLTNIPNMREFVFGYLAELPAPEFLRIMKGILGDDAATLVEMKQIIKLLGKQISQETFDYEQGQRNKEIEKTVKPEPKPEPEPEDEGDNELINYFKNPPKEQPEEESYKKPKKLVDYSQGELNNLLNQAIDSKDWERAKEIQKYIRESFVVKPFININEGEIVKKFKDRFKDKNIDEEDILNIIGKHGVHNAISIIRKKYPQASDQDIDDLIGRYATTK